MPSHMYKSTSHLVSSLNQLGNLTIIYSSQWCQKRNDINCCYSTAKQYDDLYGFHYTNQLEHIPTTWCIEYTSLVGMLYDFVYVTTYIPVLAAK